MSNRRKFIKQSVLGTTGVALSTLLASKSYALIIDAVQQDPAIDALSNWGYTIGQEELPTALYHENAAAFKVYPNHPRLYFRDTDLPTIRQRIKKDFHPEWQEMLHDLNTRALTVPAATFAQGKYLKQWMTGRNVAFVAAITGEEKYVHWAKQWAEFMADSGPVGIDDNYRGRLQSLAVAYDWLYPWLSDTQKQHLRDGLLEHIDKNWYFAGGANYVSGHSRWGNVSLAMGLLVLVDELPELHEKLLIVRDNWFNGFNKVQGWIAKDGGYHMGWDPYSGAYLTMDNYCIWSSATNDCAHYSWYGLLPYYWLYGQQGDGSYPNTGDASIPHGYDLEMKQNMLAIGAGIFKNPYTPVFNDRKIDNFVDILYGDKRVQLMDPGDLKAPLPLSRHFRNAGVVIARDRWDDKTTHLQFRSVSFYSANHHHRDENSFTLHYKGGLAIDSGSYYWYGSEHWHNYYTRTIAHNAIVVFDPEQKMLGINRTEISNDGGQIFKDKEPSRFEDILPGGHSELTGITNYYSTDEYTYSSGNASKAYDQDRVRLVQREIVYLRVTSRSHPIVVVFDRVESAKPEFKKKFLLHTVNEPVINGKFTIAENKGGRLSCLTLFPEDANLELIGGVGKEAWVDGKNYPFEGYGTDKNITWEGYATDEKWQPVESGAWRLEVSPGSQQTKDYFLHVLFVDDADAQAVMLSEAKLVKDESSMGVIVGGWNVTFPLGAGKAGRVERVL